TRRSGPIVWLSANAGPSAKQLWRRNSSRHCRFSLPPGTMSIVLSAPWPPPKMLFTVDFCSSRKKLQPPRNNGCNRPRSWPITLTVRPSTWRLTPLLWPLAKPWPCPKAARTRLTGRVLPPSRNPSYPRPVLGYFLRSPVVLDSSLSQNLLAHRALIGFGQRTF